MKIYLHSSLFCFPRHLLIMNKLLVICGPTATGKTELGVQLAKKFGGEIVSADSRQVYRGMDIATGKDLSAYGDIPVWMLDVVRPTQQFSVAQYYEMAVRIIREVWERGKLPILVGGTGLYIKAVVDGIETAHIPPDAQLRREYEGKTVSELLEVLNKINPKKARSMNESDRKNPRRLIRAIEIASHSRPEQSRRVPLQNLRSHILLPTSTLMLGLTAPRSYLYQLIDTRVDRRIGQGMVEEVEGLLKTGVSHKRLQSLGLEYKWIDSYLTGKIEMDEMVRTLKLKIHDYARRQVTWFKKDKRILWFDITDKGWGENVERLVREWYTILDSSN